MKAGKARGKRTKKWCSVGLVAGLVVVSMSPAVARRDPDSHTQKREYIGVIGYYHTVNPCSIGVACFDRAPGKFVKVSINDDSGLPAAGYVLFIVDGQWRYGPKICGKSMKIPVEPNWERLKVFIAGPAEAAFCAGSGVAGPGTKGVVTATFTSR